MIPEGTYRAKVLGYTPGFSKNGHPFFDLEFGIKDGDAAGKTIHGFLYFSTEGNSAISFKSLENAGWDGKSIDNPEGLGSVDCEIVVVHEEWKDRIREKVAWINRPGEGSSTPTKPLDAAEKARFSQALRAMRAVTNREAVQAAPAPEKPSDDDIPF